MRSGHPEAELIPYLRDELGAAERDRVSVHLKDCASCRETLEGFRRTLAELRGTFDSAPEIDWRRYRAELRTKLDERAARRSPWRFTLPRLAPIAATAAVGVLALVFLLRAPTRREAASDELPLFEQTALGSHLDLLQNYPLLEHIDLLEDLDVLQDLDEPAASREG